MAGGCRSATGYPRSGPPGRPARRTGRGVAMRIRLTPVLLAVCVFGPGCSFVQSIKRNVINEPLLAMDEKLIIKRHERLGRMAWDEMVAQYGDQFSNDYRNGFIDGFVDYLTNGGRIEGCAEVP